VLLIVLLLDPSGSADDAASDVATLPADTYVAAPTDPAVPVVLPTVAVSPSVGEPAISPRPLPAEGPAPTATPTAEQ
jgi:hypothetical protein